MSSQPLINRPFTSAAVFALSLIALVHVLRVVFGVEVVVDGTVVPVGLSLPTAVVAAALAFLVWRESRG